MRLRKQRIGIDRRLQRPIGDHWRAAEYGEHDGELDD
jgi:hypothetical protein